MERVVITGLGILAANGTGKDAFWESLIAGRSGIGPVTLFDASMLTSQIAGEVKNFAPDAYSLAPPRIQREARNTQLSIAAASLAHQDAGFPVTPHQPGRLPVLVAMGVSTSSFDIIEKAITRQVKKGAQWAGPQIVASSGIQMPANTIAHQLPYPTETQTIASACAAGLDAIAYAASQIRLGRFDIAVAGGSDAPISQAPFADFCACRMLSTRNHDPQHASRPFDRDRDGGVVAEGAAVLILESLSSAVARGRQPYAEIIGSASRLDDRSDSHESGLAYSMRFALANACCMPADIDYICAHGPSDPDLDRVETELIKEVFRDHARTIPVSSIKAVTGNPLAAAGAMQTLASALALHHQIVPMTANFEHADPLCDLDYVVEGSRYQRLRTVLINNHGISGANSSLVLRAFKP